MWGVLYITWGQHYFIFFKFLALQIFSPAKIYDKHWISNLVQDLRVCVVIYLDICVHTNNITLECLSVTPNISDCAVERTQKRICVYILCSKLNNGRSQCPHCLGRSFAAARFLGLRVRIPPGTCLSVCLSVCCECFVLSGRGLCVELITRPEESYRAWCVCVWSWNVDNEEALAQWSYCAIKKKTQRLEEATIPAEVSTRFKLIRYAIFNKYCQ